MENKFESDYKNRGMINLNICVGMLFMYIYVNYMYRKKEHSFIEH